MRELTEGQLQKTAQQIADQAMPAAKGVTDGAIRPAAQTVADKVRLAFIYIFESCNVWSVLMRPWS